MVDLRDVLTWRKELGLLPVPLFGSGSPDAWVLLNGVRGNFCLYLGRTREEKTSRNQAWSSNVGHSVAILNDNVYVRRWDDLAAFVPSRGLAEVGAGLPEFHRSLEKDAPPSELSVVAHAIGVFRRLRSAVGPDGHEALQAFLLLLAAAADGVNRSEVPLHCWALPPQVLDISLRIDDATWQTFTDELLNRRGLDLRADINLTLRHASGLLFQEAHYVALVDGQLSFPGFLPAPAVTRAETAAVGLHFTPPAIARTIVEETFRATTWNADNVTIFDPACGSGEFLREGLRQLELNGFDGGVDLIGFDISPAAVSMAKFVLAWESSHLGDRVNIDIRCCNALDPKSIWPRNVDVLLMNPPFLSWSAMPASLRERVAQTLGDLSQGVPDLAVAFLWRGVASLSNTGAVGAILPAPFLDGRSSRALRDKLAEKLNTRLAARLGSHSLFHEALVDACFYIAQRGGEQATPLALWASHRASSNALALRALRRLRASGQVLPDPINDEVEGFSIYPNPDLGRKETPWAPRPLRQWRLTRAISGVPPVKSRFAVKQGVLTGYNQAFILDPVRWQELPTSEQPYFRPCIFHEGVREGRLLPTAYVFFPYGDYAIGSEKELRSAVPTYYKDRLLVHRPVLKAREGFDENWWFLTRPRLDWQNRPIKKIVTAYFGASGSFAWDPDGSAVVVQGYGWIPRSRKGLARRSWLGYLALVNSETFTALLAAHSNHVSGGQWNLSKRFVESIPLPDLDALDSREEGEEEDGPSGSVGSLSDIASALAELGSRIHQSGLSALSESDRDRLKELTETAYLLNKDRE